MTPRILCIVHQQTSDTGRIGRALRARGYAIEVRCPMNAEPLPAQPRGYAAVVIFGGPMSATDLHLDGIRAELEWLPRVVASERPFLGVCLGAQLMARTLGATVTPHPQALTERGYYPIRATSAGRHLFPEQLTVYHWHREGFGLPPRAELLAGGERFPNQAYRYGARIYGIQFHPEVDQRIMQRWLHQGAEHLDDPGAQPAAAHHVGFRRHHEPLGTWLEGFLDHWLARSGP